MNDYMLALTLGIMSFIVALEGAWIAKTFQTNIWLNRLNSQPYSLIWQAVYFLGLPYLALISGLLPSRLFGLKGLEFVTLPPLNQPISLSVTDILIMLGNILLTWIPDFGPMANISGLLGSIFLVFIWFYINSLTKYNQKSITKLYHSRIAILFDVVHWSFYRAILWLIGNNLYLAVVGSIIFLAFEYGLSARFGKFSATNQQQYLFRFMLGLVTSITFMFVPNLWFIFGLHFLLALGVQSSLKYTFTPSLTNSSL